jgi:hypothetical protein
MKMNKPEFNELEKIELAEELFGIDFPDGLDVNEDLTLNNPREVVDYFRTTLERLGTNACGCRLSEGNSQEA